MNDEFKVKSIEKMLEERGEYVSSSSGTSMYPMLRHRHDMIVVETVKRPLKRNDVPLYRLQSGKLVLHRILKVTPEHYIIRGDNLFKKEYIKPEQIIGVLREFYRDGKRFDCATSKSYRLYIFIIHATYPFRKLWRIKIRPFLSKIKRCIMNVKN